MLSSITFTLLYSLPSLLAYDLSYFPPPLQVAPANSTLTQSLLGNANIVSAAPRSPNAPSDWTQDQTACTDSNTWGLTLQVFFIFF